MALIAGINIPNYKRLVVGLTYIYGIGNTTAKEILNKTNLSFDLKVKNLTEAQLQTLRNMLKNYKLEGNLRREETANIKRLIEIKSYRGLRHRRGMPMRANTHSNAKTTRRRKNLVVSKKK